MIRMLFLIGLGGFTGSVARYLTALMVARKFSPGLFPMATFAVNAAGCLLAGFLWGWFSRHAHLPHEIRNMLIIGFCGGFTTFSAFSVESMQLLARGQFLLFAIYATSTFAVCMLAVIGGNFLGNAL